MRFFLIGGDARQKALGNALAKSESVAAAGLSADFTKMSPEKGQKWADAVILGMPLSVDGETVYAPQYEGILPLSALRPEQGQLWFTPKMYPAISEKIRKAGAEEIRYFEDDALAELNAVLTAEGAIGLALREMPVSLWEADCLVVGYGRIGKCTARLLRAFGAVVTVSARREADLAAIRAEGMRPEYTASIGHERHDLIINTVPAAVYGADALARTRKDALIIDLASLPGGVDREAAQKAGVRVIEALSLPGKASPVTAGRLLCDTIIRICAEREKEDGFIRH